MYTTKHILKYACTLSTSEQVSKSCTSLPHCIDSPALKNVTVNTDICDRIQKCLSLDTTN